MSTQNITASEKIALGIVTGTYSNGWVGEYTIGTTNTALAVATFGGTVVSTDPRVLPITTGSNPRTLVNSYTYGDPGAPGTGRYGIFDPTSAPWDLKKRATTAANPDPEEALWTITNPYGLVVVDNYMYLLANDNRQNMRNCLICRYNITGDSFVEDENPFYTFEPDIPGDPTQWKGAGYGLDLYVNSRGVSYLIAVFARFTNENWNYTFGSSAIVKIKISDGSATMAAANANVNGVVVNGDYAFVTSFGGAQVPLGNDTSKLEIFKINEATPVFEKTITVTMVNNLFNPNHEAGKNFNGDFVDIVFVGDKVYILLAHYNIDYSKYEYIIICVAKNDLNSGSLANAKTFTEKATVDPASPCFALLPGEGTDLYFVDGVHINKIDTSVEINLFDRSAITELKAANAFTNGALVGGLINTAAVVMERTVPAPAMRMAAGAVKASVTKIAKRLARPDELERKE